MSYWWRQPTTTAPKYHKTPIYLGRHIQALSGSVALNLDFYDTVSQTMQKWHWLLPNTHAGQTMSSMGNQQPVTEWVVS